MVNNAILGAEEWLYNYTIKDTQHRICNEMHH